VKDKPSFGRVITAMVTPFDRDFKVDINVAVKLAKWLENNGSDALVIAGSTGEGTSLEDSEKLSLFEAVVNAVNIPVIASVGSASTSHSIELVKNTAKLGVAGFLAVSPYYIRPSQAGIKEHFKALAGESELPFILYNIPVRTGRKIANITILNLIESCPNIVGVKDATGDVYSASVLLKDCPDNFELYSGDDSLTLSFCAIGAVGVISVASHWAGEPMSRMLKEFFSGNIKGAKDIHKSLIDSFNFETSEDYPNPMPTKALLRSLGIPVGECRLPLAASDDVLNDMAADILKSFKLVADGF
jgi:4-hydroxy-tetrahydrodipicolinate synthase